MEVRSKGGARSAGLEGSWAWEGAPAGLALAEGIDAEPVPDWEAGLEPSQEGKGGERLREGAWAPDRARGAQPSPCQEEWAYGRGEGKRGHRW